jgi:hypothetical protein
VLAVKEMGKRALRGVQEGLQRAGGFLREKAQEAVEVQKINSRIREMQKRHEELIRDMGYRAYTMMQKGKLEEVRLEKPYREALELEEKIRQAQVEALQLRERLRQSVRSVVPVLPEVCPRCEAPTEGNLTGFCLRCGHKFG